PWVLVGASGIGLLVGTLWLYQALARGPISLAAPVAGCFPAFVVLGAVLLGRRPSLLQWGAMALVFIGGAIVARSAGAHADEDPTAVGPRTRAALHFPILISLGSAVAFAGSVLAAQQLIPVLGELHTTWLTRLVGLGLLLLAMAAWRTWPAPPRTLLP